MNIFHKVFKWKRGDSPDESTNWKRGRSLDESTEWKRGDSPDESTNWKRGDNLDESTNWKRGGSLEEITDTTIGPWSAICILKSFFADPEDNAVGTGFLISETMVITAAHNIRALDAKGRSYKPGSVSLALGSGTPFKATQTVVAEQFTANMEKLWAAKNENAPVAEIDTLIELRDYHDYGAILLDSPVRPAPSFLFQARGTEPEDALWGKPLVCAGYKGPDSKERLYRSKGTAYPRDQGRFLGKESNMVVHTVTAEKGLSGGPLCFADGDGMSAAVAAIQVRINPGEKTFGAVRITKDMERLFKSWDQGRDDAQSIVA